MLEKELEQKLNANIDEVTVEEFEDETGKLTFYFFDNGLYVVNFKCNDTNEWFIGKHFEDYARVVKEYKHIPQLKDNKETEFEKVICWLDLEEMD